MAVVSPDFTSMSSALADVQARVIALAGAGGITATQLQPVLDAIAAINAKIIDVGVLTARFDTLDKTLAALPEAVSVALGNHLKV